MKVTILGAGVIGVTTAYYLNKLGHDVTVIERNAESAAECSFANGGQLSYSHAEPWATPAALRKIPKWLVSKNSPLVFRPSLDLNMWKWVVSFLGNCQDDIKAESTKHTLRLAMYSRECFGEIIKDTGVEFSYLNTGTVHTFRDEKSLAANISQAEFQKEFGCDYEILSNRQQCEQKEPALKHAPASIIGGLYFPMDASGDINEFTINLSKMLQEKGVKFIYGESVTEILTEGNIITALKTGNGGNYIADKFIVSAGAASPLLLNKIGVMVPIYPMKGYSLSIDIEDADKAPLVCVTDQYNKIVYTRLKKVLRVAGTAEFAGYNSAVHPGRISTLKRMIGELFPKAGRVEVGRQWACLRPSTPKGTPLLGETGYRNLYLNTGHGTLGWTLSCGSAKIVADIVNGSKVDFDLTGLTLVKY